MQLDIRVDRSSFVFSKYNFFKKINLVYPYSYLDFYMLVDSWKNYFFELNSYSAIKSHNVYKIIPIYDLFGDSNSLIAFTDIEKVISNQWILFCIIVNYDVFFFNYILFLRYIGIMSLVLKLRTNKILLNFINMVSNDQ